MYHVQVQQASMIRFNLNGQSYSVDIQEFKRNYYQQLNQLLANSEDVTRVFLVRDMTFIFGMVLENGSSEKSF